MARECKRSNWISLENWIMAIGLLRQLLHTTNRYIAGAPCTTDRRQKICTRTNEDLTFGRAASQPESLTAEKSRLSPVPPEDDFKIGMRFVALFGVINRENIVSKHFE